MRPLWWENGVTHHYRLTVVRAEQRGSSGADGGGGGGEGVSCPRAHFSLRHPFQAPSSSAPVFLYAPFVCQTPVFLDRNSHFSLSLCSHVLPTLLVSRTATNAALISCKCVNRVVSPHRKIRVGEQRVRFASEATRWSGIWLDSSLTLAENRRRRLGKARQAEARLRRIVSTYGVPPAAASTLQSAII